MPLSDIEKKLLSMSSVNSDAGKKPAYVKPSPRKAGAQERIPREPKESREVTLRQSRTKEVKNDDLWDVPGAAVGVFGFGGGAVVEKEKAPISQTNAWALLDEDTGSNKGSSPQMKPASLPKTTTAERHPSPTRQPVYAPQKNYDPIHYSPKPVGFGAVGKPAERRDVASTFKFIPPMWVYEDPSHRVQGPFTSEQMHGWFKDGYFPPHLPIMCVGDLAYIPLSTFVESYGNEGPFLVSLEEQEKLEREAFDQSASNSGFQGGPGGFGAFSQGFGSQGFSSSAQYPQQGFQQQGSLPGFGTGFFPVQPQANYQQQQPIGARFSGVPAQQDNQAFLNFMQQQKESEVLRPASPVKVIAAPVAAATLPKKAIEKFEPVIASKSFLEDVIVTPVARKEKKLKLPVEQAIEHLTIVDIAEKPVPTAAPWASQNIPAKPTLKDIQEKEQIESSRREVASITRATKKNAKDAHDLALREMSPENGVGSGGWAGVTPSTKAKSMAQIMEDEKNRKGKEEVSNVSAAKGYAQSVGVAQNLSKSKGKSSSIGVLATGPVLKPISVSTKPIPNPSNEGDWNVVGAKSATRPTSASSANTANTGKPRLSYAGGVPASSASNAAGQSPNSSSKPVVSESFQTWYRKALFQASKETSLNVEEFISILLSIPVKETSTITMICDDALGGSSDSRKFATEFIKRRIADLSGTPYKAPEVTGGNGWTNVTAKHTVNDKPKTSKPPSGDNAGFEVVTKKGKKVKK